MKLFVPKGKQLQNLKKRYWSRFDDAVSGQDLFASVRSIMTRSRYGEFPNERAEPLSDDAALEILQAKLAEFTQACGTVEDLELVAKYRAVPWADGVTCEVFAWFAQYGELGRESFTDQMYTPDSFCLQADIDFAKQLAELKAWDEVKTVYANHKFD